jgi:hypothetical protein
VLITFLAGLQSAFCEDPIRSIWGHPHLWWVGIEGFCKW